MDHWISAAQGENWDAFLIANKDSSDCNFWKLSGGELGRCRELLFSIVDSAPDYVLRFLINAGGFSLASQQYYDVTYGRNGILLHEVIEVGANVTIVDELVKVYPDGVRTRDSEGQSPIDILSQKIIMSEEKEKYYNRSPKDKNLWECARVMLSSLSTDKLSNDPLVHAVVKAKSLCPESLRERAFRKFQDQLMVEDSRGNLPIHLSASSIPEDEDELDSLLLLLGQSPSETLMIRNANNHTPLKIAERSGRTWLTGIQELINAKPESVETLDLESPLYPMVFPKCNPSMIFRILVGRPTICMSSK